MQLGFWATGHPKLALSLVLVTMILCSPFALGLAFPEEIGINNRLLGSGFSKPDSQSIAASERLEKSFGLSTHNSIIVVYHSPSNRKVTDENVKTAIGQSLTRIDNYIEANTLIISFLNTSDPTLVSSDQRTTYAVLNIADSDQEVQNLVPTVQKAARIQGLEVKIGGGPAFYYDLQKQGKSDIFLSEGVGFVLIALAIALVAWVYRLGLASLLAVVAALPAVVISWAILFGLSFVMGISVFAMSVASMTALAFATNYNLLLIKAHRRQPDPTQALTHTLKTAGTTVWGAAFVAICCGAWLTFGNDLLIWIGLDRLTAGSNLVFKSIGLAALIAPTVSILIALTFTPALMSKWPQLFGSGKPLTSKRGFWSRWDGWVCDHPIVSLGTVAVVAMVAMSSLAQMRWTWAAFDNVQPEAESRQAHELMAQAFGEGEMSPIFLVYDSGTEQGVFKDTGQREIAALSTWATKSTSVQAVSSLTTLGIPTSIAENLWMERQLSLVDPTGRYTLIKVTPKKDFSDTATLAYIRGVRETLDETPLSGEVYVAGIPAENVDFLDYDREQLLLMLVSTTLILFIVVWYLTKMPVLAAKAVFMTLLAYGLALGLLVWIFQTLGISEGINGTAPAILFILLAASGTDFEFFLLSPALQKHREGRTNRDALLTSLEENRPVILIGAITLFLAYIVWFSSIVEPVQQIGVGQALGVVVDVIVIRMVAIPAIMILMGNANWWSPRLRIRRKKHEPALPLQPT